VQVSGSPTGTDAAVVAVDGGARQAAALSLAEDGSAVLTLGGEAREYQVAVPPGQPLQLFLGNGGWSCRLELLTREARLERVLAAVQRQEGAADPEVRSPMPGTVVAVPVSDGDAVEAGEVLVSVEAMKMEHHLVAPLAGTVHLTARTGDLVKADQILATIHPHPTGAEPASKDTGTDADTDTDTDTQQGEGA
jgi:acetyl-CoA/propionyl-CoA carboxylase biotin carboxyl carrier protein